jgi:hypothetical protein
MSMSGQLGRRCTVEPNYGGLSARLAGASVTRKRALETCEPSCVPEAVRSFFIPVVHSLLGAVGYVVAPKLFNSARRRGPGPQDTWQHRTPLGRKARSGAAGHVEVPELTSIGRRGPELQGTWQHVNAHPTPCLDLKLVYRDTRSAGYRQITINLGRIYAAHNMRRQPSKVLQTFSLFLASFKKSNSWELQQLVSTEYELHNSFIFAPFS